MSVGVSCNFGTQRCKFTIIYGRCYAICCKGRWCALADVIAILYVVHGIITEADAVTSCWAKWQMLLPLYYVWQTVSQLSLHVAIHNLADVITKVADGIPKQNAYK